MSRLTIKGEELKGMFYNGFAKELYRSLRDVEDVMEKHNIENANELDHSLDVLEAFKQSLKITRVEPIEPPKITESGDFISPLVRYTIEINQQKLDEKIREALTNWVMKNVDKETILKWLGVYKGE